MIHKHFTYRETHMKTTYFNNPNLSEFAYDKWRNAYKKTDVGKKKTKKKQTYDNAKPCSPSVNT